MAVDRTKFRTCDQTSFCRRHRNERSKPAFDYRLLPQSIQFHNGHADADAGANGDADAPADPPAPVDKVKDGVYQKIKRVLGSAKSGSGRDNKNENDSIDPYIKGPAPFFTATLANTSPHSYSGSGSGSGSGSDQLDLAIHLHQDGVARIRITEQYTTAAASPNDSHPFNKARWTSDELILNYDELIAAAPADIKVLDSDEIRALMQKTNINNGAQMANEVLDNFVAFQYGAVGSTGIGRDMDVDIHALLLVQFQPFEIHMWRTSTTNGEIETDEPIVSFNSDQLMHFEARRLKEEQQQQQKSDNDPASHENGNSDQVHEHEHERDEEDKHGGKEVVGYWEDGLAIYADGTREEKDTVDTTDSSKTELKEDVLPTEGFTVDTDGMWDEKFGDHLDSKPFGPMSVGADIIFPASSHIFGLPEHASSTQLKSTTGEDAHYREPYRLYNLDVFEYELDETMALYGEVPLIVSQSATSGSVGVFWFNPTETFVDVENLQNNGNEIGSKTTKTHWMSESGIVDLFLLPGPNPKALYEQYARLTGRVSLPPMFSLGYHQCRWNYRDEEDVYQVHGKFEELDYPYDVLWLDIEHTDGKRYFTWDNSQFPNPVAMQEKLNAQGRKMVTIVDPHMKRDNDYYIHKQATAKGLYIKDKTGKKDYDGWCWPGSSSYLDFTTEKVRSWWADQFAYDRYIGSTPSLFTWNDMNEPSVFNGPEVSMQKDLRNLNGIEHREWHNLYGILFQRATAEGLIRRNEGGNIRPFVLTRSFFAGR